VKEKLIAACDIAAAVALIQDRKVVACETYEEAYRLSEEIFGSSDKRTLEYKAKITELSNNAPSVTDKDEYISSPSDKPIKITKESVLATTYETLNDTRLKLILVDYIKDKTMKIYGMRKNGSFVKSLCLPYTVFKDYFNSKTKTVTAEDIKDEGPLEWIMDHISLSEDNKLLFKSERKY